MPKTIFVSGATGTTGEGTVRALLAKGANVIAGVHSPEKAGALEALGATVRAFDLADVDGMTAAMRGADGLYLVTPVSERTEDMTSGMVQAAKAAGVGYIVKLSGLDVATADFTFGHWHFAAENLIRASGLPWTFLGATSFIQNFHGAAFMAKGQGVYYNTYGSTPIPFVDARDISDVAAAVLTSDGHAGKTYGMTGPRGVTSEEVTKSFSEAAGKPISCVDLGGEQLAQAFGGFGMSPAVAAATAELLGAMTKETTVKISPDIEAILGRKPRDFTAWMQENAAAFR